MPATVTSIAIELLASLKVAAYIIFGIATVAVTFAIFARAGPILGRPIIHFIYGRPKIRTPKTDAADNERALILTLVVTYVTFFIELFLTLSRPGHNPWQTFAIGCARAVVESVVVLLVLGLATKLVPVKWREEEKTEEGKK